MPECLGKKNKTARNPLIDVAESGTARRKINVNLG